MDLSNLVIVGLAINTAASVIIIFPMLNTKKNIDDDYILNEDDKGNYTQKKHLKDRKLGILGFSLFVVGFIFQIIGLVTNSHDYWTGVYYPGGDMSSNAIYSPRFDSKEECAGWAINERGRHPEDTNISLQDLWECNKNCRLDSNYQFLVSNSQQSILERNAGPLYLCDNGAFDGGDWLRGDF